MTIKGKKNICLFLWKDHKKQTFGSFERRGVRMLAPDWEGSREASVKILML